MKRGSIGEYTEAVRGRYFRALKREKGRIFNEFTNVTGNHCKAVIHLLRRGKLPRTSKKHGRPRQYGAAVVDAVKVAWEVTDRLCSERLHSLLPQLPAVLERHGQSNIPHEIEAKLCQISPVYYASWKLTWYAFVVRALRASI